MALKKVSLDYQPQAKQLALHQCSARQILYGGAAGGGKSMALRWDLITLCLENPGCQAYLFRRTLPELRQNHIVQIQRDMPAELGRYSHDRNAYEFFNGSILWFCYCEREQDVTRYQGAEMHIVGIDEAAHLTEFQISYLKTRNRLGSWKPNPKHVKFFPRFLMSSNPGGPGHSYLKAIFLDKSPPLTLFHDDSMRNAADPEDKGWPSMFIPARMTDNSYLDRGYEASFGGLPPELARALREGDWDAVVGQALHSLARERHMIRPFTPPRHWTRFMCMDWGTASPFSVGWYAVSEGAELAPREDWPARWLPSGAVIRYAEFYGWNGKSNQGNRMAPQQVAREIMRLETERGDVMDYRVGDNEMWAQKSGPSVMEWMMETDPRLVFQKSQKDRKRNYMEILARLAGNPRFLEDGFQEECPMFYATANCTHFWRTVPTLVLDDIDPEKGPGPKQEDHVYDEVAYALRSRPFVTTEEDRLWERHGDEIRNARRMNVDPYATA